MLLALILAASSPTNTVGRFDRTNSRTPQGRSCRGMLGGNCFACVCANNTNVALQSQNFSNAAWTSFGGSVTVTASDGSTFYRAPDGTNTASRLTISAACTGSEKMIYQLLSTSVAPTTGSVWVKSISGTISVSLSNGGGPGSTTNCTNATTDGWIQCSHTRTTASGTYFAIGCNDTYSGAVNTGPSDVLIWQGQLEDGSAATCPIVTTTIPVTRTGPCSAVCQ